jgi:hypothetical protein
MFKHGKLPPEPQPRWTREELERMLATSQRTGDWVRAAFVRSVLREVGGELLECGNGS